MFAVVTWCPKATVQAALSSVALDYVEEHMVRGSTEYGAEKEKAEMVLTCAVLSIMATAPLFAALISKVGAMCLQDEADETDSCTSTSSEEAV